MNYTLIPDRCAEGLCNNTLKSQRLVPLVDFSIIRLNPWYGNLQGVNHSGAKIDFKGDLSLLVVT